METMPVSEARTTLAPDFNRISEGQAERQTSLGERLAVLRAQIVASGEKLLTWQEISQEVAQSRGSEESEAV